MSIEHIFRWDLDKTYLRTDIDSWRGLMRAAVESAASKQAFPGASALLRALAQSATNRICLVSGSPKQMRRVLEKKLALDGVKFHELRLKDNLGNLLRGRFRALRSQVPYKLQALLSSRLQSGASCHETLVGDDAEADAIVYSLYADILAGKISYQELTRIMQASRAYEDEIENTLSLAKQTKKQQCVQRILIHLDQRSPTATFRDFGERLVPVYNYFQAAVILYADGLLTANQTLTIAADMLDSSNYQLSSLGNSLQDLLRRGRISADIATKLASETRIICHSQTDEEQDTTFTQIAELFCRSVKQLGSTVAIEWPNIAPNLDFVSLVDKQHAREL